MPPPVHYSASDFVDSVVPSSLRPKKTIKKKKSTKRRKTSQQPAVDEPFHSMDENDQEEEDYEPTTINHVLTTAKQAFEAEGLQMNVLELDATPTIDLTDEDFPEDEDPDEGGAECTECVGCSWIFADTGSENGQVKQIQQNNIPRINELVSRLVTKIHIDQLARIVHTYYTKHIYEPMRHAGRKDVPRWRTKDIKTHILGHTNNPRIISDYMTKLVVSNLNGLQYCKWKKNKNDPKDIKPDFDALKEEREQMKMWFAMRSKAPSVCNNPVSGAGSDTSVVRILEDFGMAIKYGD